MHAGMRDKVATPMVAANVWCANETCSVIVDELFGEFYYARNYFVS